MPPEKSVKSLWWMGRRLAVALLLTYALLVPLLALGKLFVPLFVSLTWAAVFYGPAITIVCCYALVMLGGWISARRREA